MQTYVRIIEIKPFFQVYPSKSCCWQSGVFFARSIAVLNELPRLGSEGIDLHTHRAPGIVARRLGGFFDGPFWMRLRISMYPCDRSTDFAQIRSRMAAGVASAHAPGGNCAYNQFIFDSNYISKDSHSLPSWARFEISPQRLGYSQSTCWE